MDEVNIQSHLNTPELRIDTWNRLAMLMNDRHAAVDDARKLRLDNAIQLAIDVLKPIEHYHAFPGHSFLIRIENLIEKQDFSTCYNLVMLMLQAMRSRTCNYKALMQQWQTSYMPDEAFIRNTEAHDIHYFEVLMIATASASAQEIFRTEMAGYEIPGENFVYEWVFVDSFEDAIIAVMFNFNIKCCVISDFFQSTPSKNKDFFRRILAEADSVNQPQAQMDNPRHHAISLGNAIRHLREREIDIYYLASSEPESSAANPNNSFDKIFYEFENYFELHLTILKGIKDHYETPFFDSLKKYTFEPKSTFHALPVARGKSVFKSRWIRDMETFYGKNIFLAESSATAGGLDSLMNPIGSIKQAMLKASRYFGSHETFFVSNGTSASNNIVLQTLVRPGDVVLLEHACHESHHYALIMMGAYPVYLNGYHMAESPVSGPVPLSVIKETLRQFSNAGELHRVKLIILTNCTFDGLVYHPQRYMEEILAIKPDIAFLWDEAWFAYARCVPHYRVRTAMYAAAFLEKKYRDPNYKIAYEKAKNAFTKRADKDELLKLPDPDLVVLRVYSTQSTHKTLSCLRQGSMIHVFDEKFALFRESFGHAFMAHSTTSPNYQIVATMDLARRQAELEGFEFVQQAIELSMFFRQRVNNHPLIGIYFRALGPTELIPACYRLSKVKSGYNRKKDWGTVVNAWMHDDFVVDPTRVTLLIKDRLSGYALKTLLMNQYGIQVNKVSFNSILLQFNIGTSRSAVSYLLDSLYAIAGQFADNTILRDIDPAQQIIEMPGFSAFHPDFLENIHLPAGRLREAFYQGQDLTKTTYCTIETLLKHMKMHHSPVVSASMVIPYPPGYPVLLPGQIITEAILNYLLCVDPGSILGGYQPQLGIKIFQLDKLT